MYCFGAISSIIDKSQGLLLQLCSNRQLLLIRKKKQVENVVQRDFDISIDY